MDELSLRRASLADAGDLLRWRNDALTRVMSLNGDEVSWSEHCKWLDGVLQSDAARLYIVEADGCPAGSVRFEGQGDKTSEVSIVIAPDSRGRGIAATGLASACRQVIDDGFSDTILARVKAANTASRKLFEQAGFALVHEDDGVLHYSLGPRRPASHRSPATTTTDRNPA